MWHKNNCLCQSPDVFAAFVPTICTLFSTLAFQLIVFTTIFFSACLRLLMVAYLKILSQDPFSSVMCFFSDFKTHTCSQQADGETQTTCNLPSSEAHSWCWDRPSIPHTNVSTQLSEQGKSQWGIKWGETSRANTGNSWTRTELWNFSPLRQSRCHYGRFMNGAQCHCRSSVTES